MKLLLAILFISFSISVQADEIDTTLNRQCIQYHTAEAEGLYDPQAICSCVDEEIGKANLNIEDKTSLSQNCPNGKGKFSFNPRQTLNCSKLGSFNRQCVVKTISGKK